MAETYTEGLTFEKVWAALMENREQMKETDKQIKNLNEQMGGLHRSFGELAEHLVAPGIAERFNELGYHFDAVSPGGHKILDEKGKEKTEIDILLENGDCIMAVEVKTKPRVKDIEHHIRRLEILREHRNKHKDKRIIKGAVAWAISDKEAKQAAHEAGFYVLVQSGDTMKMETPEGFEPRVW